MLLRFVEVLPCQNLAKYPFLDQHEYYSPPTESINRQDLALSASIHLSNVEDKLYPLFKKALEAARRINEAIPNAVAHPKESPNIPIMRDIRSRITKPIVQIRDRKL